jgi:hypothetical protein
LNDDDVAESEKWTEHSGKSFSDRRQSVNVTILEALNIETNLQVFLIICWVTSVQLFINYILILLFLVYGLKKKFSRS